MGARQISIYSDSQLIVNQITADFAAKDASMSTYLSTIHQLLQKFQAYEIRQKTVTLMPWPGGTTSFGKSTMGYVAIMPVPDRWHTKPSDKDTIG
ncbi:unnamed protein product [Prunus armeniaca]